MPKRSVLNISLARKCQLLFGAAVLSIIAASLVIPGIAINSLTQNHYLQLAKETASIVLLTMDLQGQDWSDASRQLAEDWPRLSKVLEGEGPAVCPQLITLADAQARFSAGARGFLYQTVSELQANPQALYRFKITHTDEGGDEVRLAMAVRAQEAESDAGSLRGLIEVRVPIDPGPGLMNLGVLAAALASGALLALLVFYLITQKLLLSPVRKLRRLAERVTTGDMEARSTIATGDEFEDLANAFNDMLVHLQTSQEELQTINRSLDTRLGELAETNVALYENSRLKSEFIANVSHELRTPLVSIIGFAELLVEAGDRLPEDRSRLTRYSGNILTSGRMLLEIINDLLDLAKIEAGKLELHLSDLDVGVLCNALIDFVKPLADKKSLSLKLELAKGLGKMNSDAGRIKQILYNLLSNAIKFTPDEGAITLSVQREDSGSMASASEPKDFHPPEKLFEKRPQEPSRDRGPTSGTGPVPLAGGAILAPETRSLPYGRGSDKASCTPSEQSDRAQDGAIVSFSVTDTGPGIPSDQQSVIFEKFRQLDSSVTRTHGGAGLGLAITRDLCTLLGGSIEVHSKADTGSTFTVKLPAQATTDRPEKAFIPLP